MVCRTTALGSAVTSLARLRSGLEDQQTLSAYHALLRQGQNVDAPSVADKTRLINELRTVTLTDTDLSETRRDSLIRRFDQAVTQPMDGRSFYAAQRILTRTGHLQAVLNNTYDDAARNLGLSRAEAAEYVRERRAYARAHPAELADPNLISAVRETMGQHAHGTTAVDRYTSYALHQLQQRINTARVNTPQASPTWHTSFYDESRQYSHNANTGCVTFQHPTGPALSYPVTQSVFDHMHRRLQSGRITTEGALTELRTDLDGQRYTSANEAAAAAGGNQCGTCGQYAGPGHACPVRDSAAERHETLQRARGINPDPMPRLDRPVGGQPFLHRGGSGVLRMPMGADVRLAAADGPVQVPVVGAVHTVADVGAVPRGDVRGRVLVSQVQDENGVVSYTVAPVLAPGPDGSHQLRCTCADYQADYDCCHVRQLLSDVTRRVNSTENWAYHLPLAQAEVAADLAQDHAESLDAQQVAITTWGGHSISYTADPFAFRAAYKAAKERVAAGQEAIPYMTVNATGGLGAPDTGRGFGVEVEFEFPSDMSWPDREEALAAIGNDLHEANLTSGSYQNGYHNAERIGYTTNHNGGWSFEHDETVAGEIVSPIMHDTPETWENLAEVCDIVKRHGGIANTSTGSHVHVSAHNYDHTVGNYNQLMSTFAQNEDVLYRMAMNPESNRHRGTYWCRPNNVPAAGYTSVDNARNGNDSHGNGVNLSAMWGQQSDHVEFRMWDGTLSPAAIQAQVKLSLGITEAAFRGGTQQQAHEPLGSHRSYNRATYGETRRLSGDDFDADTASFRRMADDLFDRDEDKAQMAALFAVTKWQRTGR